jgi:signal transduction histidine kinase
MVRHGAITLWRSLASRLAFLASLACLACPGATASASAQEASAACTTATPITQVMRTVSTAAQSPGVALTTSSTQPVPDALPLALRGDTVRITYDIDISVCAQAPAVALWIFRAGAPYRIEAQGVPLRLLSASETTSEPTTEPTTEPDLLDRFVPWQVAPGVYNGRLPALFAVPAGTTHIRLMLQTLPYLPSGLVKASVGPTNLLLPVQTQAMRQVAGQAGAASGVVLVIGLMALLLWLPRRSNLGLLWLAVACGLWGVRGLIYYDNAVAGSPQLFEMLNPINALLAATTMTAAVLFWMPPVNRRHLHVLVGITTLSLAGFGVAALAGQGAGMARGLAQLAGTAIICWLGVQIARNRNTLALRHFIALMGCLLVLMVCLVHDLMVAVGTLPPSSDSYLFWGFVAVLVGFAVISGEYTVVTLNQAEHSNEELERRVHEKSAALAHSYAQLRDTEIASARDAARAHERERLLRDMHDGMGAQLMTALRGVERGTLSSGQVAQSLQDGLDELRLLMDSADIGHHLPPALATWRNRWDARLSAAGLALQWHVDDALDPLVLPGDTVFQIMRILQEAAANIVKHAQASHLAMRATVEATGTVPCLHIELTDDGRGLGPAPLRTGARGLKNMNYRAQQIGAQLTIESLSAPAQGCRVLLRLPLP